MYSTLANQSNLTILFPNNPTTSCLRTKRLCCRYASSLLLVYEAQTEEKDDDSEKNSSSDDAEDARVQVSDKTRISWVFRITQNHIKLFQIFMIDFGHVLPIEDGGVDDGYIHGVKSLIEVLAKVRVLFSTPLTHIDSHIRHKKEYYKLYYHPTRWNRKATNFETRTLW